MNPARFDLFGPAHKALRRAFYLAAMRAGATDWTNEVEVNALGDELDRAIAFMRLHIRVEDSYIHPAIESKVPGTTAKHAQEHVDALQELLGMEGMFNSVRATASNPQRARAIGLGLYRALNAFVAHHQAHFQHEEELFNPLLWSHYSDDQLAAIQGRVVASMRPDDLRAQLALMLPAMPLDERVGFLAGIRASTSDDAFEAARAHAQQVLTPEQWAAVRARL